MPRFSGRRRPRPAIYQHGRLLLAPVLASATADGSGTPASGHLFYAVGSARWWMLWIDSGNSTLLRSAWSTDLLAWTADAILVLPLTASFNTATGRNLAAAYRQITSTDVVHVSIGQQAAAADTRTYHARATISGTTLTWTHAPAQIDSTTETVHPPIDGGAVLIDANGSVLHASGLQGGATASDSNQTTQRSSTADAGTSWTAGFAALVLTHSAASYIWTRHLLDLGGGTALIVSGDGGGTTAAGAGLSTNVRWSKWTGTNWTAGGTPPDSAALYGAAFTADMDDRDLGVVARTTTDVHIVLRRPEAGAALNHWRYNGTAWTQQADLPTQATKTPGGVFLASDGTGVWCFAIASAAGNAVRVSQWTTGGGWGAWADFETASATRASLSGSTTATTANGNLGVLWTEGTAAPFQIVTKPLALSTGAAQPLAATVTAAVTVAAGLTVVWSLADAETVTATTSASLAVARPLATQATATATTTADLAATRPLAASVVVVAAWSATLGVSQQAAGVVTVTASGSGTLRAAQPLAATSTPVVAVVAALQAARPLAAAATLTATGAGDLAVGRPLAASATTATTATATTTLAVSLAANASAQAAAQADLGVQGQATLATLTLTATSTLADVRLARPLVATATLTATAAATLLVTRPAPSAQARLRTHDLHRRASVRSLARTTTAPRR